MKKILLFSFVLILIPLILINVLTIKNDINLTYVKNSVVRLKRVKKNVIEEVPLEDYIIGVVAAEMPNYFEEEALKAQAVAARTYVLRQIKYNKNKEYDVVDTTSNQAYLDFKDLKKAWGDKYDERIKKIKDAVISTIGEYMVYDGEIIQAFFFSTSSGMTENSEDVFSSALPYLKSVNSSWDAETSSVYSDTVKMTKKEFLENLGLEYNNKIDVEVLSTTNSGMIKQIKINGTIFKGVDVRSKLKLRSANFKIIVGNDIIIETHGFGHGVGLSQYGAEAMALKDYSYDEILKYYYQGIEIIKI